MTAPSTPRCRLCEASEGQRFIDLERRLGWGQSFIHCSQCNNGYLWPDLSLERLSEFYRVQYRKLFYFESANRYDESFITALRLRQVSKCRLLRLRENLPSSPRVLEVGSGFGAFLAEVHRSFPLGELHAIEPDIAHREVASQNAPIRFYSDLSEVPKALNFDLIVLFHTLEHLTAPLTTLVDLRSRLSPTGQIAIEVPDCLAPWTGWTNVHPAHLSYFTSGGLDRLTASAGLVPAGAKDLLPGSLWRVLTPTTAMPPMPATPDEVSRFSALLTSVRWTRRQALRRYLRQVAVAIIGPGRLGQIQRFFLSRQIDADLIVGMAPQTVKNRRTVLGVPVDLHSFENSLSLMRAAIRRECPPLRVGDVNVAKLMQIRDDPDLLSTIAGCGLICADGMGVVWAGRLLGVPIPERVTGIDLMQALLGACAENGWRPFLLGAEAETLTKAIERIKTRFPALVLAGHHHGYFTADEEAGLVTKIRYSKADCLIVGMGSPRQEFFLERSFATLEIPVAMGVGGSFDVLAGKFKRAPRWMQRFGLEWIARLAQDPQRLARRYFVSNSRLIGLILMAKLRRGLHR